MKRRDFILLATTGVAAIAIPTYVVYFRDLEYDSSLAQPDSLLLIWDKETVLDIGAKYRAQVPAEDKERSLVKKLLTKVSAAKKVDPVALEQTIKKDFETGNTVTVDGWILSVTEARQCALFSAIQFNKQNDAH